MQENAKKKRWPWVVGAVVIACAVAVALIVWMSVSGNEGADSVLAETGKAGAVENNSEENDFEDEKLSPESFKGTEAEYYAELDKRMPAGPELADYAVIHKDENGIPYREQLIDIFFKGDVSESEAQRIISNFGGEYAGGFFGLAGLDEILAYSIFPEGTDVLSLSKQIAELPEVNTAAPSYYIKGESA